MEVLDNIFLNDSLKRYIKNISNTDSTVLITGESGVGKEVVAKAIHKLSSRSKKEPVIINVAAIPEALLEKELFGSSAGAFTDSTNNYLGKFQLADQSTIILDEIAEIPLNVQGKLLSVIENGVIQPLGSNEVIKLDCRIIAVTNKNLIKMTECGLFRKDLYYRLNVINFEIPPLRDRTKLIKTIILSILDELSVEDKKYYISKDGLDGLLLENWPGNLRELKNRLERAIVISDSEEISSDILLLSSHNNVNISGETLKEAVKLFKKRYITQALEVNEWNVSRTAKVLDIQRTYLSRLIKELNIE